MTEWIHYILRAIKNPPRIDKDVALCNESCKFTVHLLHNSSSLDKIFSNSLGKLNPPRNTPQFAPNQESTYFQLTKLEYQSKPMSRKGDNYRNAGNIKFTRR